MPRSFNEWNDNTWRILKRYFSIWSNKIKQNQNHISIVKCLDDDNDEYRMWGGDHFNRMISPLNPNLGWCSIWSSDRRKPQKCWGVWSKTDIASSLSPYTENYNLISIIQFYAELIAHNCSQSKLSQYCGFSNFEI